MGAYLNAGEDIALTLHFVQPPQYDLPDLRGKQEYIEYFADRSFPPKWAGFPVRMFSLFI